jgi:hypothetical protein
MRRVKILGTGLLIAVLCFIVVVTSPYSSAESTAALGLTLLAEAVLIAALVKGGK